MQASFANAVDYSSGGYEAFSVAVADVIGNGIPDLLVTNYCPTSSTCPNGGTVAVLLGNGDGTFQTAVTYPSGGYEAYSIAVQDVNNDGHPDLLVANLCASSSNCNNGTVSVLLNNGNGTFQKAVPYSSGGQNPYSVAVADVNNDGIPDLLLANNCASDTNCNNGTVSVLLGNGNGTFQTAVPYASGGLYAQSVAVADVNGDNSPDLLVSNQCNNSTDCTNGVVSVLLNNGNGTFQTAVPYSSGGLYSYSVAASDLTGNGNNDLLVANYCASNDCPNGAVGMLLNNGDGTFQSPVLYPSGGVDEWSVAVADVNGDGIPDLVTANLSESSSYQNGGVAVLLGNGDGTFQTAVPFSSGGLYASWAVVQDVNGDGKPDILVANYCATSSCANGSVGVLLNTTNAPTSTALTSSVNPSNFAQAVTFTATVTSQGSKTEPTGSVSFYDGTTSIGNSNLNGSGLATLMTSALPVGTDNITAAYNGDTNFAPSTSPVVYQVVQGALVLLSPTSLNFGNQTVGLASNPQTVTLTNTGNANLNLTSIQITGADSGEFAQSNNCPASVPANGNCTISVTFTPTTTGTRNAALTITDNAPNSPQSVPLQGVGVSTAVIFSPTSLNFPTQLISTTSPAKPATMTNGGTAVLNITSITVTGPFSQTNNCPGSLNPNTYCTINVEFHPTAKGTKNGSVNVNDNAPGSPQTIPLTGKGTYVQLVPAKVAFGNQPTGTKSQPKKITLTNKAKVVLDITGITITGTDKADFSQTNNCGHQVQAGANCSIEVTFDPSATGARVAEVSISDNGGGGPQTAPLSGTGTQ
jgi:uncharacterized protein (UPF0548 family)